MVIGVKIAVAMEIFATLAEHKTYMLTAIRTLLVFGSIILKAESLMKLYMKFS